MAVAIVLKDLNGVRGDISHRVGRTSQFNDVVNTAPHARRTYRQTHELQKDGGQNYKMIVGPTDQRRRLANCMLIEIVINSVM